MPTGILGGARSLQHARHLLLHLGSHMVPALCILPNTNEAFDERGGLMSPRSQKSVDAPASQLGDLVQRLG